MLPLSRFLSFTQENLLFSSADRILLAVSGGKDSVLMAHLFNAAGFDFGIAHCNFGLRGEASDADESFTGELARQFGVPFFSTRFDTGAEAASKKISIQMAARDLRYTWFEEIRATWGYDCIALAHHRNDSVETILLNLTRGTGISGLHGILPKRDKIRRPLLFLDRDEVDELIHSHSIAFREDESNASVKYARNKIRHQVIPVLKQLNPNLEQTFASNSNHFSDLEEFLTTYCNTLRGKLFIPTGESRTEIAIEALLQLHPQKLLLFELFRPYHFTEEVLSDLVRSWNAISGKLFLSATHRLLIDRSVLVLEPLGTGSPEAVIMHHTDKHVIWNGQVFTQQTQHAEFIGIVKSPHLAYVDSDSLVYPLTFRSWQEGDAFYPLGMTGKKKVSDFFINLKIPLTDKMQVPLLINGNGDMIWVAGYRLDDRYKIHQHTKKVTIFERINSDGK